jgi:hypothetical protein
VNLSSHLQRKTRQTNYIIVIDICSFRLMLDVAEAITMSVTTGERPGQLRITTAGKEMGKIG